MFISGIPDHLQDLIRSNAFIVNPKPGLLIERSSLGEVFRNEFIQFARGFSFYKGTFGSGFYQAPGQNLRIHIQKNRDARSVHQRHVIEETGCPAAGSHHHTVEFRNFLQRIPFVIRKVSSPSSAKICCTVRQ